MHKFDGHLKLATHFCCILWLAALGSLSSHSTTARPKLGDNAARHTHTQPEMERERERGPLANKQLFVTAARITRINGHEINFTARRRGQNDRERETKCRDRTVGVRQLSRTFPSLIQLSPFIPFDTMPKLKQQQC